MIRTKISTNKKEQVLVRKILAGNEQALRSFYKANKEKIYLFIFSKISNRKDVEEVFSDTFLASIEALRDFTFSCSLSTFLYGIARHKIIDYYRKQKIEEILFSKLGNAAELVSHLLTPEEEYSQAEIQKAIEKTLKNLPWRYAKILKLKYIDGLTVKEIALRFTETVKQSEATLFRARKAFVGVYQQWQNGNNYLLRRRHTGSWRQKWLSKPNFRPKI